jgi:ABC-type glutathione transport system ATPase component
MKCLSGGVSALLPQGYGRGSSNRLQAVPTATAGEIELELQPASLDDAGDGEGKGDGNGQDEGDDHDRTVEKVPESLSQQLDRNECVAIKSLFKEFKTAAGTKVAVDRLNMTFYSGQITALLGHNGAGKTTTIAMLTGLMPADGGTAVIEGLDINYSMDEIRKSVSLYLSLSLLFYA